MITVNSSTYIKFSLFFKEHMIKNYSCFLFTKLVKNITMVGSELCKYNSSQYSQEMENQYQLCNVTYVWPMFLLEPSWQEIFASCIDWSRNSICFPWLRQKLLCSLDYRLKKAKTFWIYNEYSKSTIFLVFQCILKY